MTKLTGALNKLQIQNFKSLKDISISPGRVNVFIGKPNAGKTNLLEALTLLGMDFKDKKKLPTSNLRYTDIASLFYDQNYDQQIAILTDRYAASMSAHKDTSGTGHGHDIFYWTTTRDASKLGGFKNLSKGQNQLRAILATESWLQLEFNGQGAILDSEIIESFLDRNSNIKRYQFSLTHNPGEQMIGGKSLWEIIRHNSFLKSFAKDFFKEFSLDVLYDKENKMHIMRRNEDNYYLIDFSMTPDTFQRMLYYLAVTEANKNSVILLEEPESQSYPPYIQMLADKIVDDKHNQYFITTHSPFIVEKMLQKAGPDGDVKIFVTYFEDYQTKVHELTPTEIDYIIENSVDLFFNIESFQK